MSALTGNNLFKPGTTCLHKLDPRIKVVFALITVMLVFASSYWTQLSAVAAVAVFAVWVMSYAASTIWRVCWLLRWLLLFTLLMHLLFSPGQTLMGLSWLSYDGLVSGAFVCVQLILSVVIASLMAMTTPLDDLVAVFGWLVTPLRKLGCQTENWQKIFFLTLTLIPVVQDEILLAANGHENGSADHNTNLKARMSRWIKRLKTVLLQLVNRGDAMAHDLVETNKALPSPAGLTALFPLSKLDLSFVCVLTLIVFSHWLLD